MELRGHCLCKRTGWVIEGPVSWSGYCHCDDCRRNCGAPVVAWLGVPSERFIWTGDTPRQYESSAGVQRYFCGTCGSPMAFEAEHYPGVMNLYVASLEDPSAVAPEFHVNHHSRLPWLALEDDLAKYDSTLLHAPENRA